MVNKRVVQVTIWSLIIVGIIFASSTLFSVIGGFDTSQTCEVTDTSVPCIFDYSLEQNRGVSIFTADFDFESVPETEFKSLTTINSFAQGGAYIEEADLEEVSSLEDYEKSWIYLYRIPSDWGVPHVLKTSAETVGTCAVTASSGICEIEISSGIINEKYPYNTVIVCNKDSSSDCQEGYIVYTYEKEYSSQPDEKRYTFNDDSRAILIERDDLYINDRDVLNQDYTTRVFYTGENDLTPYYNNIGDMKDLAVFVRVDVAVDNKGFTTTPSFTPPILTVEYKEAVYPTNVKYRVGYEGIFYDTLQGAQKEPVTTLDFSDQINEYCGRNDGHAGKCDFKLQVYSDTIGKIVLEGETTTLKIVEGDITKAGKSGELPQDENNTNTNTITGAILGYPSFDFSNEPVNAGITVGLILVILIVGISFIPFGGKRK